MSIVQESQNVWQPMIESLTANIGEYTRATTALAAVTFPTFAVVAGVSGIVILTVAALDMNGIIDVEDFVSHYS